MPDSAARRTPRVIDGIACHTLCDHRIIKKKTKLAGYSFWLCSLVQSQQLEFSGQFERGFSGG